MVHGDFLVQKYIFGKVFTKIPVPVVIMWSCRLLSDSGGGHCYLDNFYDFTGTFLCKDTSLVRL